MTGQQLRTARTQKGWNQIETAARLGVSQTYLSLLEREGRRMPAKLAVKGVRVFGLSQAFLPVSSSATMPVTKPLASFVAPVAPALADALAKDLAALGYPGFAHLHVKARKRNPAEVLFTALRQADLESRLVEALPWVVWRYPEMNWAWLSANVRLHDLQNRLGFVVNVARRLAQQRKEAEKAAVLLQQENLIERARLVREDTLCHDSLTSVERRYLRQTRPDAAKHWRLLTDLAPEHLAHVTE
jgi:transcriptional regulator with XRE-family HTH domain